MGLFVISELGKFVYGDSFRVYGVVGSLVGFFFVEVEYIYVGGYSKLGLVGVFRGVVGTWYFVCRDFIVLLGSIDLK